MTISSLRDLDPAALFAAFNQWPTLRHQGIQVVEYADDFSWVQVRLELTPANANYMGTAFGGSLFSMLDPFLVVLTMNQLGSDYVVWDKAAEIDFVRPGTGPVVARIEMPAATVAEMREAARDGAKVLRWFSVDITDEDTGNVVATSRRQLYVRQRRQSAS